jgi:acetoin utilization protein AcuB
MILEVIMKVPVSESMNKKIYTVSPDKSVHEAYEFMKERRIRHLVVVDGSKHVVGVLSDRDVLRAMHTDIEQAGSVKVIGEHFNSEDLVQDYMSWDIQTLGESAGLRQAALKMLETKISSLVVVNENHQMVGFITSDDLLWVLVKLTEEREDDFLLDLKAQILNSPLGAIANSISQTGL